MAEFDTYLITVGGLKSMLQEEFTGKVYHFKEQEQSQEWVKFLKPMPTARSHATTPSAIVASGGAAAIQTTSILRGRRIRPNKILVPWRCTAV